MAEKLNIGLFLKVWSEILSDHYGVKITLTAIPKDASPNDSTAEKEKSPMHQRQ